MSENRIKEQLKQDQDAIGGMTPSQEAKEKSLCAMKEELRSGGDTYRKMEKKKRRNQTLTGITATVAAAGIGGLVLISSDDMAGWFNPAGTVDDHDNEQDEQEAPEPATDENEDDNDGNGENEEEESEGMALSDVRFDSDKDEWDEADESFSDEAQRFEQVVIQASDPDDEERVYDERAMTLFHQSGMPYSLYYPEGWTFTEEDEGTFTRYEIEGDGDEAVQILQFETGDVETARAELERLQEPFDAEQIDPDDQWLQNYLWPIDMESEPVTHYRAVDGEQSHNWSFVSLDGYPDTPVILYTVEEVETGAGMEWAQYMHRSFQPVYPVLISEGDDTGMNDRALEAEWLSMSDHGPGPIETVLNEVDDLGFSFYKRSLFSELETGDRGQRMIRHESEYDQSVMEIGRFETVDEALTYQQDWRESESELADQAMEKTDSRMHVGNLYGGEWLVNRDVLNLSTEVHEELEMEGGLSEINGQEMFFVIEYDGYGYYMKTGGDQLYAQFVDHALHTWQWEDGTMLLEHETD